MFFISLIKGNKIPLCNKVFLNLHAVSNYRLQRLNTLSKSVNTSVDLRRKHNTRREVKFPEYNIKVKGYKVT